MEAMIRKNAPSSGLPGCTGPIDSSEPSGANTEAEMVTDMSEDGNKAGFKDDIFHPRF